MSLYLCSDEWCRAALGHAGHPDVVNGRDRSCPCRVGLCWHVSMIYVPYSLSQRLWLAVEGVPMTVWAWSVDLTPTHRLCLLAQPACAEWY